MEQTVQAPRLRVLIWKRTRYSFDYVCSLAVSILMCLIPFELLSGATLGHGFLAPKGSYRHLLREKHHFGLFIGLFLYAPVCWLWFRRTGRHGRHGNRSRLNDVRRKDAEKAEESDGDQTVTGLQSSLEVYTTREEGTNSQGQKYCNWAITLVFYTPYWLAIILIRSPFGVIQLTLRCFYAFCNKTIACLLWLFSWCFQPWRLRGCHDNYPKYPLLEYYNYRWAIYRRLPLKSMSRAWGRFNQRELPNWFRGPGFRFYIWLFGVKLEEALIQDLCQYRNLSEFFRRRLRSEVRPIQYGSILTSPADGRILHLGKVEGGVLEQVKGVTYSLSGFLGQQLPTAARVKDTKVISTSIPSSSGNDHDDIFESQGQDQIQGLGESEDGLSRRHLLVDLERDLYQCIVYLGPGDYHSFHSPVDWVVTARRHFPGELFSVNPGYARWLQGLFNFNERAVYFGRWRYGFFSLAAVGATNVGSINVEFDQELQTNLQEPRGGFGYSHRDVDFTNGQTDHGIPLKKGERMGDFNFGSTVVLLFEAPKEFRFELAAGERVKYGERLGTVNS